MFLKQWLQSLGLPTTGSRAEIMARLLEIPPEQRGSPPESQQAENIEQQGNRDQPLAQHVDAELPHDEEIEAVEQQISAQPEQMEALNDEAVTLIQLRGELNATRAMLQKLCLEVSDRAHGNLTVDCLDSINDVNIHSGNALKDTNCSGNAGNINDHIGTAKYGSVEQRSNQMINKLLDSPAAALSLAKEVAMDYNGDTCARAWISQMQNISQIYNLDVVCMRMLFIAKLKGKAQQWLHNSATRILEPVDQLFDQLYLAFGNKTSKAEARSKFQNRKWLASENFGSYFDEKMRLADDINIDMEELLECIIDGISSKSLRDQARIQCFSDPRQILQAFSSVRLPELKKHPIPTQSGRESYNSVYKDVRCVNCNSKGHLAIDCHKPKRERGSCYACGAFGHFVAQCPERKSATGNQYRAS
ncbi:uncharacterized protein [Drosophila tropicalis]|uniref:uncharacterized protein n=1 Tax=Drosophila tropicalis TaxID=46794 RepID=UPI0035ABABCC